MPRLALHKSHHRFRPSSLHSRNYFACTRDWSEPDVIFPLANFLRECVVLREHRSGFDRVRAKSFIPTGNFFDEKHWYEDNAVLPEKRFAKCRYMTTGEWSCNAIVTSDCCNGVVTRIFNRHRMKLRHRCYSVVPEHVLGVS